MTQSELSQVNDLLLSCKGFCCLCMEHDDLITLVSIERPDSGRIDPENLIPLCPECCAQAPCLPPQKLRDHKISSLKALKKQPDAIDILNER